MEVIFSDKSQRKEFVILGLIPESIKCCSGIGPSILRDQSDSSIVWTLGSLPEPNFFMLELIPGLDWDFTFSHVSKGKIHDSSCQPQHIMPTVAHHVDWRPEGQNLYAYLGKNKVFFSETRPFFEYFL